MAMIDKGKFPEVRTKEDRRDDKVRKRDREKKEWLSSGWLGDGLDLRVQVGLNCVTAERAF